MIKVAISNGLDDRLRSSPLDIKGIKHGLHVLTTVRLVPREMAMRRSDSYTMGCPHPRALASILRTGGKTWYNYLIPTTSVKALHITRYFVLNGW